MPKQFENQCELKDLKEIKDGKIVIYQAAEDKGVRVEKSVDDIYELIIKCKSDSIFPDEIGQLSNLHALTIVGGDFKKMSLEIGRLKKLELLILLNTSLASLPKEFYRIPSLKRLAIMYSMNEFEFQEDLCKDDFRIEVMFTSSAIRDLPNCLKQKNYIQLVSKEAY